MVAEFRPAVERDKGGAVALLRRTVNGAGPAPAILYIGDDVTDEDAFRTLDRNRDLRVVVADPPRPSAPDWCVPDTDAVGAPPHPRVAPPGRPGRAAVREKG